MPAAGIRAPTPGRSMSQVVDKLRPNLPGWKAYFGLVQTPGVWRELDEWLRHRLRAIQLRHWKRPMSFGFHFKGALVQRGPATGQ